MIFDFLFPIGANEPQYNWEDITDNFTEAASGRTVLLSYITTYITVLFCVFSLVTI